VIQFENHSFDNVLGDLCAVDARCDGATTGQLHDGSTIALGQAADIVVGVDHSHPSQRVAINRGGMNGFDLIGGCGAYVDYQCYTQYAPDQIPNLALLSRQFVISDRTFQNSLDATWVSHLQLVTADADGFRGDNPYLPPGNLAGPGWGCDSNDDALWHASVTDPYVGVPSCVPAPDGSGPYRATSVSWEPTIMDRMDQAGLGYLLYVPGVADPGYARSICPTFANCLYGPQQAHMVPDEQFVTDAAAGTLPAVSILMPDAPNSQHNQQSMLLGDNWLADQVNAVMNGPDWGSSAIFITQDDCGCFYDHVAPPPGLGIRTPMTIVSPYAIAGSTDSNEASYSSILAFVEHTFGLAPLSIQDAGAYDYSQSFDYGQRPLGPVRLVHHRVPKWELEWLSKQPFDASDPT
jgi:phospholipase C